MIELGLATKEGDGIRLASYNHVIDLYGTNVEYYDTKFDYIPNVSIKEIIINLEYLCIKHNLTKQIKANKIKSRSETATKGQYIGKIATIHDYKTSAPRVSISNSTFSEVPNISNKAVANMTGWTTAITGHRHIQKLVNRNLISKNYRFCILDNIGKRHFLNQGKVPFLRYINGKKEQVIQLTNSYYPNSNTLKPTLMLYNNF